MTISNNIDYKIQIIIKIFSLFLCVIMKDKKSEHIHDVIQPWDVEQFIRTQDINMEKIFDE